MNAHLSSLRSVGLSFLICLLADTVWGAEQDEKSNPPLPPSPFVAQQQLSEIAKQVELISADLASRDAVLSRLKAEHDKLKGTVPAKALQEDVERLARQIESQPKDKGFYSVARPHFSSMQNLISKISDDVWESFPGVLEIWRNTRRDPRTLVSEDQFLSEAAEGFQNALWQVPQMRQLEYLRGSFYVIDSSTSRVSLALTLPAELRAGFDAKAFVAIVQAAQGALVAEMTRHEAKLGSSRTKLASLKDQQRRLQEAVEEGQSQIDKKIIQWGLPAFGLLLLGILAIPKLYKDKELQATIFSSGIVLDMFTVFLLTITILLLGLGHRLSENVLGTLLGGISGYVLGRSNSRPRDASAGYRT